MGDTMSHVKIELIPESEAVKVVVTNDGWREDDPAYAQKADGWPRTHKRRCRRRVTTSHKPTNEMVRRCNPSLGGGY